MSARFDAIDRPEASLMDACVHCGFCLPTCPTYVLWGEEMDSPRGRIYLMRAVHDGQADMTRDFVARMDACLGCMGCVTACPSGVQYGALIERTRSQIERHAPRTASERLLRAALFALLPYPRRLRAALALVAPLPAWLRARIAAAAARVWRPLGAMLSLLPAPPSPADLAPLPRLTPAIGAPRLRVGLLAGCVQQVLLPGVNHATARVFAAEGCEVHVPAAQACCGALSRHAGRLDEARAFARRTIAAFEASGVDLVVVNAAGCGSSMKEYGELFHDDSEWRSRAVRFASCVRDAAELLVELGQPRAPRHPVTARVACHDACHLAHAQRIRSAPRQLLAAIPGVTLVELPESDLCCGSAGIYNIVQPAAAAALGDRKADHIVAAAPDVVMSANPGCTTQIGAACARRGVPVPVRHPIEVVDASIRNVPL